MHERLTRYFDALGRLPSQVEVTGHDGHPIALSDAVTSATRTMRETHDADNKLIFIGNGGSAGISSHMAVDYSKNGGIRATALNDSVALTCLGNDLGYENVFGRQIELYARAGDLLMALSSSGRAPNVLNAVDAARQRACGVFTFSGFRHDNPLRTRGDLNFYVPASEYGFVEITHLVLCHAFLDLEMGWGMGGGITYAASAYPEPQKAV